MADLTLLERLQPSLLDRLVDDQPHRRQESRDDRVLSMGRLRQAVQRDLAWLLNTVNLEATDDLGEYPLVARSVLNFGLPDLTGLPSSSLDPVMLERVVRQAIWDFEPRISRHTVKVRVATDRDAMSHNALTFYIEGELWAQPTPIRLYLKSEIDLEIGQIRVSGANANDSPGLS